MTSVIELQDAAVDIGGRRLWSGVDLRVDEGELACGLGPNGVGKSTLLNVLLGLVPLAAGRIRVLDRPPRAAGSDVGYLPQRRSFDDQLRIRGLDLVRLGLDGQRWGLPLPATLRVSRRATARARDNARRVDEVIEMVGASGYARRPIGELSGGEQQRLLIAQALASRPRLLLLDEPLDSLDLPHQSAVASLVSSLARTADIAVVMVAHDVNPIVGHLDRVAYLAGGAALVGPPAEVLTTERLSRLYRSPVEVLRARDGRLVVVGSPESSTPDVDRHAS